jgi:hypothetical protein
MGGSLNWIPLDMVKRITEFKEVSDVQEPRRQAAIPEEKLPLPK